MNMHVVPPTPSIQRVVSLLEKVPVRLEAETSKLTGLGQYYSDVAVQNFLQLIVRNVEAILHLGCNNLLLLHPALIITRPILETGCNTLWLMIPQNPYDRENRLIAFLDYEIKERKKYLNNIGDFNIEILEKNKLENDKREVQNRRDIIKAGIPSDSYKVIDKPNFQQLLKDPLLNLSHLYPSYRVLSQFTHGTHAATWSNMRKSIEPEHWRTPLFVCWWILAQTGAQFLTTYGGDKELFLPKASISLRDNSIS